MIPSQPRYTTEEPSWQLTAVLVVVTSLFCLHLLRNIWIGFPILAWVSAISATIRYRSHKKVDLFGATWCLLLLFAICYTIGISFIQFPDQAYLPALARLLFVVPFAVFVALVIDDGPKLTLVLQTFAFWVAISVTTMLYQAFFGPVDWFALPTVRNGTLRYASLLGNLTALGFVGGLALPLCYFLIKSPVARGSMLALVVLGLALSLQKAAILNACIFALLVLFLAIKNTDGWRRVNPTCVLVWIAIIAFWSVSLSLIVPKGGSLNAVNTLHGTRSDLVISHTSHNEHYRPILKAAFETYFSKEQMPEADPKAAAINTDVELQQGLVDRFFSLPLKLVDQYGSSSLVTGVGLVGASGSLGFLETSCSNPNDVHSCKLKYPMAHNAAVEFLVMGGLPLLLSFCMFVFLATLRVAKAWRRSPSGKLESATLVAMFLFVPNAMMSSGVIIQPYIAGILYTICIPVLLRLGIWEGKHKNRQSSTHLPVPKV